eukprot:TRINITY_DN3931_c0_g1_i1.p1 TRINITY_DN3931_c0_g1~~TRINITY_DN3931_c0_g1_i1.p1  ORF type:complete len:249 (-),score=32.69 TRINITY_DN3931_c0_g1_i1:281-1027(-)
MSIFAFMQKKVEEDDRYDYLNEFDKPQVIETEPLIAKVVRPRENDVEKLVRVVCISDTHVLHRRVKVPEGDILIHAGDFGRDSLESIVGFSDWLATLPHKHKIVIAGNHDSLFDKEPAIARENLKNCVYLQDSGVTIEGIKFWGAPLPPFFLKGPPLEKRWSNIPNDVDVLITHGPPLGFGGTLQSGIDVGCRYLAAAILERVKPKVSVFGHIHEGYGVYYSDHTTFINASICTKSMSPSNPPVIFDI